MLYALPNPYGEHSDEALIPLIAQGETAAFDELYQRYHERLLHYFYRMLKRQRDRAQDLLQELFLKVIEKSDRICPQQRFSTWVFAVAHNMCCNEYRYQQVRRCDAEAEVDQLPAALEDLDLLLDQQRFKQALLRELEILDEDRRSIFLLRYQENFSLAEISAIMQCSLGTVKSRLFYTARHLARQLSAFAPCTAEE